MPHTPPNPLIPRTTLIPGITLSPSTSPALDTLSEPRIQPSINKLQVIQNAALNEYSHTRAPTAPRLPIQTENTTSITSLHKKNILQNSRAKKSLSLTTPATQQIFPQSLQQT